MSAEVIWSGRELALWRHISDFGRTSYVLATHDEYEKPWYDSLDALEDDLHALLPVLLTWREQRER